MFLTDEQKKIIDQMILIKTDDNIVNDMIAFFEQETRSKIENKIKELNNKISETNKKLNEDEKISVSFLNDISLNSCCYDFEKVDDYLQFLNNYIHNLYKNNEKKEDKKIKVNIDALKEIIEETKKDMKFDKVVAEQTHSDTETQPDMELKKEVLDKIKDIIEQTTKKPELLKPLREQVTEKLRNMINEKDIEQYRKDTKAMDDKVKSDKINITKDPNLYYVDVNKLYNVYKSEKALMIVFNIPGFEKENILIYTEDNILFVKASKPSMNEIKEWTIDTSSFNDVCEFKKQFYLDKYDISLSKSKMKNGRLFIEMPIKQVELVKTFNIEIK